MKITVLGAGAWGTALALHASARHPVTLWVRDAALADTIRRERLNPRYLPGVVLTGPIDATADLNRAVADAGLVVIAT
jgi:glycerol-3-phosphate dehydrogenase (NAD(P)+)